MLSQVNYSYVANKSVSMDVELDLEDLEEIHNQHWRKRVKEILSKGGSSACPIFSFEIKVSKIEVHSKYVM